MTSRIALAVLATSAFQFFGCDAPPEVQPDRASLSTTAKASEPGARPELVPIAPSASDGPAFIKAELERAEKDGRKLVIYIGAEWCEPCQHFHQALERGELDKQLPNVRFLDFDFDKHAGLLEQAACQSKLVPLFARPTADGKCSDKRTEGGIKGSGAVGHIVPRLKQIL